MVIDYRIFLLWLFSFFFYGLLMYLAAFYVNL